MLFFDQPQGVGKFENMNLQDKSLDYTQTTLGRLDTFDQDIKAFFGLG